MINIKYIYTMSQLIKEVIMSFKSQIHYQRFIKEAEKEISIKTFRLAELSFEEAEALYSELQEKYSKNYLFQLDNGWHEHQRRLFIWFIVCYMHYKLLDPIKLVHNEKYYKHWQNISHSLWNKNISLLQYQLLTILKNKNRITWNQEQDNKLLSLYKYFLEKCSVYPKGQWNEIAKALFTDNDKKYFKTAKHCRERWQNHLNPEIRKGQWKNEEDYKILYYVKLYGCKWSKIAEEFSKSRTEHMIKNRYKAIINKFKGERSIQNESLIVHQLLKQKQVQFRSRRSILKRQKTIKQTIKQKEKHKSMKHQRIEEVEIQYVQSQDVIDDVIDEEFEQQRPRRRSKKTRAISKDYKIALKPQKLMKSETVQEMLSKSRNNSFFSSSFHRYNEEDAYKESNFLNNIPMNQLLFSSNFIARQNGLMPGWQDKRISGFSKILGNISSYAPQFQPFTSKKQNLMNESMRDNISFNPICSNESVLDNYIQEIQ